MLKKMKITVLFDGKCGVCSKEISFYKRVAPKGQFIWQDVNSIDTKEKYNIELHTALKHLHVIDNEKVFIGVDAFVRIWKNITYFKFLSFFIQIPLIYSLAKYLYTIFAEYRFKRLKHCQILEKETK
jgi:predicted DCC family thiol-disulfide oxidoreductase YuxK